MYEYIKGQIGDLTPTYAVIDAGGVGYFLNISLQTFSALSDQAEAKLYTHFIVREDAQVLYGFVSRRERELFRLLIGVSGVGGNTARMILSTFTPDELQNIIFAGKAEILKQVKGLGIKTAQKIIVELKDKVAAVGSVDGSIVSAQRTDIPKELLDEALQALTMLGFARAASEKVLRKIYSESPSMSVEDAIRTALKQL